MVSPAREGRPSAHSAGDTRSLLAGVRSACEAARNDVPARLLQAVKGESMSAQTFRCVLS